MTNGFCFINNVAVAAAYLKNNYRLFIKYNQYFKSLLIRKVAIVDFDVHHGNGTQEIVECLRPKEFTVEAKTPFSTLQEKQW
jgi:acetoin utilization deacetylase AcuC-like enzyme